MKRYRYVGLDNFLKGHTALGMFRQVPGNWAHFLVQVDDIQHPWSHKWHVANVDHWKEIT